MDPLKPSDPGYIPFPSNSAGIKHPVPLTPKEDDLPPGLAVSNTKKGNQDERFQFSLSETKDKDKPSSHFYKGGQFIPGGGRAPKGGVFLGKDQSELSEKGHPDFSNLNTKETRAESKGKDEPSSHFYKGGQFIPGGGRLPISDFLFRGKDQEESSEIGPPGLSNPDKKLTLSERLAIKRQDREAEKAKAKESILLRSEKPVTPKTFTNPPPSIEFEKVSSLSSLGFPKHNIDPGGEESKEFFSPESAFEKLKENLINPITLMNEVNSKIDQKFDPVGTEFIVNKTKQFECNYVYEGHVIGNGKGGSKQEAKTKAAEETISAILKGGETFAVAKKILVSSIQKKVNTIQKAQETPAEDKEKDNQNPEEKKRDVLYEFNLMCQDNFTEPIWEVTDLKNEYGEYEATLTFKDMKAFGKGRKKIEAKREAAHTLLTSIRETKSLADLYLKRPKNKQAATKTQLPVEDLLKYETPQFLGDSPIMWNQEATETTKNLEEYLLTVEKKNRLDKESLQLHLDLYDKVADNFKKIVEELRSEKHELFESIKNLRLIPIGSYALDCLIKNDHSIDVLLKIEKKIESKKISPKEFLDIFKEKFDNIEINETQDVRLKAEVKKEGAAFYLEVVPADKSDFKLTVSFTDSPLGVENIATQHIIFIYGLIKPEKRVQFKRLMRLMRIWRVNRELEFIAIEVLDALLLNEFLNNKADSCAGYIQNILMILMSDEVCRSILKKFGDQYLRFYEKIPSKPRYKIVDFSTQSLAALSKKDFEKSFFK